MNDTKSEYDRLMRGFLLVAASMSGVHAIAPLGLPAATMEYAAFSAWCVASYGVFIAVTADPTIGSIKRIVPEQYH